MNGLKVKAFWTQKSGNEVEEYEDAYSYEAFYDEFRVAIADGTTDGFACGQFAKALTDAFVAEPPANIDTESMLAWLVGPIRAWRSQIPPWEELPGLVQMKLGQGSFATLLGITFLQEDGGLSWRAMANGDTCLFHLHGNQLLISFPMKASAEFDMSPALISTRKVYNQQELQVQTLEGQCQAGDILVLATDALAAWFLKQWEEGGLPLQEILVALVLGESFPELVQRLRKSGQLKNDDVTLIIIGVGSKAVIAETSTVVENLKEEGESNG